jgi:hypothetical protein
MPGVCRALNLIDNYNWMRQYKATAALTNILKAKPASTYFIFICAKAMLFDMKAMNMPGAMSHIEAPIIGGITTLKPATLTCISKSAAVTPNLFSSDTATNLSIHVASDISDILLALSFLTFCIAIVCIVIYLECKFP